MKKLRVRIQARQVVKYDQVLELTPNEWSQFKTSENADAAGDWLNKSDVSDADAIEELEATVVGKDGKPINPDDSIEFDE